MATGLMDAWREVGGIGATVGLLLLTWGYYLLLLVVQDRLDGCLSAGRELSRRGRVLFGAFGLALLVSGLSTPYLVGLHLEGKEGDEEEVRPQETHGSPIRPSDWEP